MRYNTIFVSVEYGMIGSIRLLTVVHKRHPHNYGQLGNIIVSVFSEKNNESICIAEVEQKMFAAEYGMHKIYIYIYEDTRNDFAEVLSTCDNSWNFVFKWVMCFGA